MRWEAREKREEKGLMNKKYRTIHKYICTYFYCIDRGGIAYRDYCTRYGIVPYLCG